MHFYLACFDISDDRRRYRVAKALAEYGSRVQRSVFEISLKRPGDLDGLRRDIAALLEEDDDCRFYLLCASCRKGSVDAAGERIAQLPAAVVI